jgi:hypothetical protein
MSNPTGDALATDEVAPFDLKSEWPAQMRQKAQGTMDCPFWMEAAAYVEQLEAMSGQLAKEAIRAAELLTEFSADKLADMQDRMARLKGDVDG